MALFGLVWRARSEEDLRRGKAGARRVRPWLEVLEDRTLLSTFHWLNNASGDFNTAANWQENAVPGATDDAEINFAGITVTSASSRSINGLTSSATLSITGGTFTIAA